MTAYFTAEAISSLASVARVTQVVVSTTGPLTVSVGAATTTITATGTVAAAGGVTAAAGTAGAVGAGGAAATSIAVAGEAAVVGGVTAAAEGAVAVTSTATVTSSNGILLALGGPTTILIGLGVLAIGLGCWWYMRRRRN